MNTQSANRLNSLIKSSKFVDPPRKLSPRDYLSAGREYQDLIKFRGGEVISIYQVGSMGVIGISDIDYIIIFKDEKKDVFGRYHIANLSERSRYIFSHNVFYLNESLFNNLGNWFPFFDLKHVWGKRLKGPKPPSEETQLILTVQYLLTKIPRDLLKEIIKNKKIPQRDLLCVIHSVKHTKNLLKRLGVRKNSWESFFDNFDKFRSSWFDQPNRKNLLKIFLKESLGYSLEIIEELDKLLKKNLKIGPGSKSFDLTINGRHFKFSDNWSKDSCLKNLLSSNIYEYPISFSFYLHLLKESNTLLGDRITSGMKNTPDFKIPKVLQESFDKYTNSLEEYNDFCRKKFHYPSGEYHNLGTGYYKNRFLDNLNDKVIKGISLPYILTYRLTKLFRKNKN